MLRRDFTPETKATVEMLLKTLGPRPFSAPGAASPAAAEASPRPEPESAPIVLAAPPA
jgi:hypothetical protein